MGAMLVSVLFVLGALVLLFHQSGVLQQAERGYDRGEVLNLDGCLGEETLAQFLLQQGYMDDERDAQCVAAWLTGKVRARRTLPNLGAVNSPAFLMPATFALEHGGSELRRRVEQSAALLGQTDSIRLLPAPTSDDAVLNVRINGESGGVEGVAVRLREHYFVADTLASSGLREVAADSVVGYALTDGKGVARFAVECGRYYSVLPVRKGYEYGAPKGTRRGPIAKSGTTYTFRQREHCLRVFTPSTYQQLKNDVALTVRTPSAYRNRLLLSIVLCLTAWWGGLWFLFRMDRRHGRSSDFLLPLLLMALTLLGVLTMFSLQQPLTDKLLGWTMTCGLAAGVAVMCLMSRVNYLLYYVGGSKVQKGRLHFDFVRQGIEALLSKRAPRWSAWCSRLPEGVGYLLLAMLLVVLLRVFGTGPEGSDARVNLFFFQPSEVSKYLFVVFVAAFFATNATRIQQFSQRHDRHMLRFQFRMMTGVVLTLCVLLAMYLMLLSDMGPALVIMLTFIFLYSLARRDFGQMVLGVVTFSLMLAAGYAFGHSLSVVLLLALLWYILWIFIGWVWKHRVYESALFLNLLLMAFLFGGELMVKMGMSEGVRLMNRTAAAWAGVWHNDVPGGDQVAQGIWSLAAGGLTGQGLGQGNPNLVPAHHTDMVFTSIGETMGWIGMVLVVIVMAVLIHRSLLLARRAGHPFAFYLAAGIAMVTGVQFFVIVLGSIGLIPLTGVSVPFLSFGMSSLVINMAAFGVVLSVSRERATRNQQQEVRKYDGVVISSMLTFFGFALLLVGSLFYYQVVARNTYLVRPACVVNLDGALTMEYNPRIELLMQHLDAGNIYDRNGVLLATSRPSDVAEQFAQLRQAGAEGTAMERMMKRRQRRYYPFADQMFFMLGDYNTRTLWSNTDGMPSGYMAENRHLTELRGFDNVVRDGNRVQQDVVTTRFYRQSPFLPPTPQTMAFTRYDYSDPALLEMLRDGIGSKAVAQWNERRPARDLTLTIDARLQVQLQNDIRDAVERSPQWRGRNRLRASVVVLDAAHGDLLCSANYPLPDQDTLRLLAGSGMHTYNDYALQRAYTDRDLGLTYQTQPGSTAKVMSAMAGLMRMGDDAARQTYVVHAQETVEPSSVEPWGEVSMERAIVQSSNCYFVNLVHDHNLYPELETIYAAVGARIDHPRLRRDDAFASHTPYFFDRAAFADTLGFGSEMQYLQNLGLSTWRNYKQNMAAEGRYAPMSWWQCGMAWGQGMLTATPLNMARVVSVVANDGRFMPTRYVLQRGTGADAHAEPLAQPVELMPASSARLLRSYMQKESDRHRRNGKALPTSNDATLRMGGKTGTPERVSSATLRAERGADGHLHWVYPRLNDGWYVFFIPSRRQQAPLAVAVRLERLGWGSGNTSGAAVSFVADTVIPALRRAGYVIN